MFGVLILLFAIALFLFYHFTHLPFKYWKNRKVPHPPVSYLFGNYNDILLLKRSLRQLCHQIYHDFPELAYVGFYKVRTPCIVLRDIELIKEVLVRSFNSFQDNHVFVDPKNDPYFTKNPFVASGVLWKEARSQSSPAFTTKRMREVFPLIEGVANNFIKYLKTNTAECSQVDIKELCLQYTTDVVASCVLGLNANSFVEKDSEYIKMIKRIVSPSFINAIKFVILFNFPLLSKLLKVKVIPDEAAAYYKNLIRKTLEYRAKNAIQRGDFLDSMKELREKIGPHVFTDDDITAHVLSFFTDGTETSSIVLSFALYELALNADVQANLLREIQDCGKDNQEKLNYDAIQNMEYLDMVINESMRKNTPLPVLSKLCTEKFTLPPLYKNGESVTIEAGTPIMIPAHSIHHDPEYYPHPTVFDPLRFSQENIQKRPKYSFLAFGEGPRVCVGRRFGISQIKVALVHILLNFELKINKSTTVPYTTDPHYFMLATEGEIKLDFHKRA